MIRTTHPSTGGRLHRSSGFTLTEVLIALALVSLLLVGISRIFALTSTTIGTGQALSTTLRSQRAIAGVMGIDFLGEGRQIDPTADPQGGMMPLVNSQSTQSGAPFLMINNYRIAAFLSDADARGAVVRPDDTDTYIARSTKIRTVDDDGDPITPTVLVPIYQYGQRNFRCDTIGFFTKGNFQSQTDSDATSNDAFVWYGHLRVFNGKWQQIGYTNAYGYPGEPLTPGTTAGTLPGQHPNINNLYADQFILGRFQTLLIEPIDHDGNPNTLSTVVADNDPSRPIPFIARDWQPNDTAPKPFNIDRSVEQFDAGFNKQLDAFGKPGGPAAPKRSFGDGRCDIVGTGANQMRDRIRSLSEGAFNERWTFELFNDWTDRFFVNPFPSPVSTNPDEPFLNRSLLNQRQQMLATNVTQFIVEFAGDFVTQDANTGAFIMQASGIPEPDGVIDFVQIGGLRTTRWYGMPRDADGDGFLDVMPVRYFAGNYSFPFERDDINSSIDNLDIVPNNPNFLTATAEVGDSPNKTRYSCVWGPNEFEKTVGTSGRYAVPRLIRVVVEARDEGGKLKEGVTQEYVYPVPNFK